MGLWHIPFIYVVHIIGPYSLPVRAAEPPELLQSKAYIMQTCKPRIYCLLCLFLPFIIFCINAQGVIDTIAISLHCWSIKGK